MSVIIDPEITHLNDLLPGFGTSVQHTTSALREARSPRSIGFVKGTGLAVSLLASTAAVSAITPPASIHPWSAPFIEVRALPASPNYLLALSTADAVRSLHLRTGLSWDQLSRLFGVSRRSIHNWASGGSMNAANAERLEYLTRVARNLPPHPVDARSALLAPDASGVSRFQQLLRERDTLPTDEGTFRVEELLGARRDRDVTTVGKLLEVGDEVDVKRGWPKA